MNHYSQKILKMKSKLSNRKNMMKITRNETRVPETHQPKCKTSKSTLKSFVCCRHYKFIQAKIIVVQKTRPKT